MSKELKIQRASAGSGKTYALAKTFILNLIAYKNEEGKWVIRNHRQIEDAMTHILAITFTNKATNEMKTRIVENLSLLSKASDNSSQRSEQIPYLTDIHEITGASYDQIGLAASKALRAILNNYSSFKISTIDSFFQEIMRTFTYEANINESYQLEIDSGFVADAALDSAIQELDSRPYGMGNVAFWLRTIMRQEAKKSPKWNLFNKKATSRSIYSNIRNALYQLESEDFKNVKEILDNYFSSTSRLDALPHIYQTLKEKASEEREEGLNEIRTKLSRIMEIISLNGYTDEVINVNFFNQAKKIMNLKPDSKIDFIYDKFISSQTVFKKKFKDLNYELNKETTEMYTLIRNWENPNKDTYYKCWTVYGDLLPYLGLILDVRKFLSDILHDHNLLQLSDTSYILSKVIGDDDAPFVFERLGNRVDNYLIDEFQDTSRMQWEIIQPLLQEGLSKGNHSLIIGDPKQSIYRFRNADHSLITDVVPQTFPDYTSAGFSKEENTNWRSHTRIVKFNNYFFKALAYAITQLSQKKDGNGYDFNKLYANVVQYPSNQEGKGFVEVRVLQKPKKTTKKYYEDEDDDQSPQMGKDWFESRSLSMIGPLVSSLIERGYRQNEIAILVNTNKKGKMVIEKLIEYNATLPPEIPKIDFISEESLLISSSQAVETILGVLKKLSHPELLPDEEKEESGKVSSKRYVSWQDIKTSYTLYSSSHSDIPAQQRLINFLDQPGVDDSITSLIAELPTPSLSSIVESTVRTFLDENQRRSEAVFISSFQDLVKDYVSSHHNDPASFLEWWNLRGIKMSVNSPEGTDAVEIMTIHKSKGLEFKCVIVPFANDSFPPSYQKNEWRWVKPEPVKEIELPPVLPVKTSIALKNTGHEHIYKDYYDQSLTDKLNMYYVAYTRARNELYLITPESDAKTPTSLNDFISHILKGEIEPTFTTNETEWVIKREDIVFNEENFSYTYGQPLSTEEIAAERKKEEQKESLKVKPISHTIESYTVNSRRPKLLSVASKINPKD
ncbi:MAG: UvrD-helicase domain-containing protein [Muribaculaceae bacterium]|nr:UvrD-helicase domain-containing protein [Muribaculaceae bacterium]